MAYYLPGFIEIGDFMIDLMPKHPYGHYCVCGISHDTLSGAIETAAKESGWSDDSETWPGHVYEAWFDAVISEGA